MAKKKITRNRAAGRKRGPASVRKPKVRAGGMLEQFQVEDLLRLMFDHGLSEIDIRDGDRSIAIKRAGAGGPAPPAPGALAHVPAAPPPAPAADEGLIQIKSPMVGTFYAAPDPESPPYVKVNSEVGAETIVCIVEAMKVMNEIKAECSGTIARRCVENGEAVEFGQTLFLVHAR